MRLMCVKTVNSMALWIFQCLFQQPGIVLTSGMHLKPDFCLDWMTGRVFVKRFKSHYFHNSIWQLVVQKLHWCFIAQKTSRTYHNICWIYLQNFFLTSFECNRFCLLQLIGQYWELRTQLNICHGLKATCDVIKTSAHVWSHCTADSKPLESQCN